MCSSDLHLHGDALQWYKLRGSTESSYEALGLGLRNYFGHDHQAALRLAAYNNLTFSPALTGKERLLKLEEQRQRLRDIGIPDVLGAHEQTFYEYVRVFGEATDARDALFALIAADVDINESRVRELEQAERTARGALGIPVTSVQQIGRAHV